MGLKGRFLFFASLTCPALCPARSLLVFHHGFCKRLDRPIVVPLWIAVHTLAEDCRYEETDQGSNGAVYAAAARR